jgi:hypothetical protein
VPSPRRPAHNGPCAQTPPPLLAWHADYRPPLPVAHLTGHRPPLLHVSHRHRQVLPLLSFLPLVSWTGPPFLPPFWRKETVERSSTLPPCPRKKSQDRASLPPPHTPLAISPPHRQKSTAGRNRFGAAAVATALIGERCLRSISGQLVTPLTSLVLQVPSSGKHHRHRLNLPPH